MIDTMTQILETQVQERTPNFFAFIGACLAGGLGLLATGTLLALASPAPLPLWILVAVGISAATSGYTLFERRQTSLSPFLWSLGLGSGVLVALGAWRLLASVEQTTWLSVLSPSLVLCLGLCGLIGSWLGALLRLQYEKHFPSV